MSTPSLASATLAAEPTTVFGSALVPVLRPRRSPAVRLLRALVRDPLALAALLFLLLLAVAALLAPWVAPFDPADGDLAMRNQPPLTAPEIGDGWPHLLGTDALGRDQLSRIIFGARISLLVAVISVLLSGILGTIIGLAAGYFRGIADDVAMRFVDLQMGFPSLLLALFVLYVIGAGLWNIVLVLALTRWMVYARVSRGLMLASRENVYVEAARAVGCGDRRIILRHLLPNLLTPLLVLATLEAATMILTEASLSFLGLGLPLGEPSWGQMLAQGRKYVTNAWWLVTFPGLAILLTALSFNLLATWLRSVTDPSRQGRS